MDLKGLCTHFPRPLAVHHTVKLRYNKGPKVWQNLFAVTRFCYIYRVCYIEVPLYWDSTVTPAYHIHNLQTSPILTVLFQKVSMHTITENSEGGGVWGKKCLQESLKPKWNLPKSWLGGQTHKKKPALGEHFYFLEQHNWCSVVILSIFFEPLKKYCFEPDWWVRSPVAWQKFHSKDVIDQIILKFFGTKFVFFSWDKNISYLTKWLQNYYDQGWQS